MSSTTARDQNPWPSIDELRVDFERAVVANTRAAAEIAYALAFRYRGEDIDGGRRFDLAGLWAQRAIELLDTLPSETIEQVASMHLSIGGVPIPDLLHSDVVRARLNDVLYELRDESR